MGNTVGINLQPVSDQTPGILNRITGANKLLMTASDGKSIQQVDPSTIAGAATFTVGLVARSNVATLSGVQTIDNVATSGGTVLLTAQTTGSQNQIYQTGAGAWTPIAQQPVIGQTIFVTGGQVNSKQFFTLVSGTAGTNATFIPGNHPAKINPSNAPWLLKLDGSDETTASDALFTYAATLTATGGCYIEWPAGTLGRTTPVPGIQFCSHIGAGHYAFTFTTLDVGQLPCDTFLASSPLNIGQPGGFTLSNIRFKSAWFKTNSTTYASGTANNAAGSALVTGKYYFTKFPYPAPVMLKCVTAGATGAHMPIGDLTPVSSAMQLIGIPSIACSPVVKIVTPGVLGVAVIQISVDNAATWSANVPTAAGDSMTVFLSAYAAVGASYAILISNQAYSAGNYTPTPRIQILGTPANDDSLVDVVIAVGGPLGTATVQVGSGINTEKWLATSAASGPGSPGSVQSTASGAFWDYAIPATSLTARFYAGVYTASSGGYNYRCTSYGFGLRPELGSTVTDNAATWQVVKGPSCMRFDGVGNVTLRDVTTDGGCMGITLCQAEAVTIEGSCMITGTGGNYPWFAGIWQTNGDGKYGEIGQYTNQNTIAGSLTIFSYGFGMVHDGGIGFTLGGSVNFQKADSGFAYLAGIIGGAWLGSYVESGRGLIRDCSYASRVAAGKLIGVSFDGFSWSSVVSGNYSIDAFGGTQGCKFHGAYTGAIAGIRGIGDSTDVIVSGTHTSGGNVCDAQPAAGHTHNNQVDTVIAATCIGAAVVAGLANGANANVALPLKATAEFTSPSADFSVSGLVAIGNGQRVLLRNRSAFRMTVQHASTGSTAGNRFICPGAQDLVLAPGGWADVEKSLVDTAWVVKASSAVSLGNNTLGSGVAAYTFVLGDAGRCVDTTDASAVTLTVPPASSVLFPPGTVLSACALAAGAATIAAGAGVTIRYPNGKIVATTASQYAHISVRLTDTANTWVAFGNLA